MKIGNQELPDICPECNGVLIKTPGCRLIREGGPSYSTFSMNCMNRMICGYKSETI